MPGETKIRYLGESSSVMEVTDCYW